MELDLPQVYQYHVFVCNQQRPAGHPRGDCVSKGGTKLWERLGGKLQSGAFPQVGLTVTSCLGFCSAGPLMVVYPEGIWYRPQTPEDIDEILQSHFVEGKPVERLVVVLSR
jgi:(2Fe-2S) ferredoxin